MGHRVKNSGAQASFQNRLTAMRPNRALNLTLCGGPALAIILFLAKASPPQSAG